ncbi:AraC family transcriptional regulator [Nitrospirillum sp. BR 11163]|uniref:helix-turn-helix domain-containing protein n=1 Tax=Nitrospirillum sp. BR 11163 TaxID=3104323 RepID=UPI002AFF4724|nr:AraC family transcriptional regulator [Nitrospirillum sp. BR 11163]MEA1676034.1 AraC family transcriptional regulator [Nitrospirillum sp. BR 11163]
MYQDPRTSMKKEAGGGLFLRGGLLREQTSKIAALARNARAALTSDIRVARRCLDEITDVLDGVDHDAGWSDGLPPLRLPPTAAALCKGGLAPWQLRQVLSYVEQNMTALITVGDLSGVVGLSRSYFARAFKISTGETVRDFINRQRIRRAQALMVSSDAALCAIAVACGFSDQAHFSRRFRQMVGETPRRWRRTWPGE